MLNNRDRRLQVQLRQEDAGPSQAVKESKSLKNSVEGLCPRHLHGEQPGSSWCLTGAETGSRSQLRRVQRDRGDTRGDQTRDWGSARWPHRLLCPPLPRSKLPLALTKKENQAPKLLSAQCIPCHTSPERRTMTKTRTGKPLVPTFRPSRPRHRGPTPALG